MFGCPSGSLDAWLCQLGDSASEVELELACGLEPAFAGLAHQLRGDRRAQDLAERRLRRRELIGVRQEHLIEALLGGRKRVAVESEYAPHEAVDEVVELRLGDSAVDPSVPLRRVGIEVVGAQYDLDR